MSEESEKIGWRRTKLSRAKPRVNEKSSGHLCAQTPLGEEHEQNTPNDNALSYQLSEILERHHSFRITAMVPCDSPVIERYFAAITLSELEKQNG